MSGFTLSSTFIHEAEDLLAQIEEISLELDDHAPVGEEVHRLFRAFHTIKGSSAMFGLTEISGFTHHLETVLDSVREGAVPITYALIKLVLATKDEIKELLDAAQAGRTTSPERRNAIIEELNALHGAVPAAGDSAAGAPAEVSDGVALQTYRIRFHPEPTILSMGINPAAMLAELRELGTCTVSASIDAVPVLEQITPDHCYLQWEIILASDKGLNAIKDVFIFVEDCCELTIQPMAVAEAPAQQLTIMVAESPASQPTVSENVERTESKSEHEHAVVSPNALVPTGTERSAQGAENRNASRSANGAGSTVRVPSDRLDRLVSLVGELVTSQSRLTQVAARFDAAELAAPVEEIERLISELRENVLGIRMMPIGTTFSRFKRLVHDLSGELGKEIELVTEGAETEVDKTVLDQIGEPLVHLMRNSIDHGIETGELRQQAGKPRRGTIRLSAAHIGSNVVVKIQDDGRGLDKDAIRAKAVDKRLIAPDASLSDKEIFNLIFLPGFSTAKQVTSISGRGVGMDVVKRQIEALRGAIEISSQVGQGTTISLTLPLTLAIIDGLLVEIDGDQFIVPMSSVTENVELSALERSRNNARNVVAVRGELISYIRLRELFGIPGDGPVIEKIVIAQHGDQRIGIVVDRVLGSHQTVIQSLGRFYRNIEIASGATIMGDGRVALILDLAGVVRSAEGRAALSQAA